MAVEFIFTFIMVYIILSLILSVVSLLGLFKVLLVTFITVLIVNRYI